MKRSQQALFKYNIDELEWMIEKAVKILGSTNGNGGYLAAYPFWFCFYFLLACKERAMAGSHMPQDFCGKLDFRAWGGPSRSQVQLFQRHAIHACPRVVLQPIKTENLTGST